MSKRKIEAIDYHDKLPFLCVFHCGQPLFAAREIAEHLGYVQVASLRKQTLTAWKLDFVHFQDYFLYTTEMAITPYETLYKRVCGTTLKPVKPERGRLFYTAAGLLKVFDRTTKDHKELLTALKSQGFITPQDLTKHTEPRIIKPLPVKKPVTPKAPVPLVKASKPSLEERRFEYEAVQKLIRQLERLDDPGLRNLAVMAAETALGKKLPYWTPKATVVEPAKPAPTISPVSPPATPVPVKSLLGPYFIDADYYSLSRIGEKAGGYASVVAGKAADIVGASLGYTREELRTKELPINELKMRPDSTSGTDRRMFRFNLKFSNAVILELRKNSQFQPAKVKVPDGVVSLVSGR